MTLRKRRERRERRERKEHRESNGGDGGGVFFFLFFSFLFSLKPKTERPRPIKRWRSAVSEFSPFNIFNNVAYKI